MSISYRVNCGGETSVRIVFSKGKAKRVPSPDRARTYDSCGHLGAGPHSIDTRLRGGLHRPAVGECVHRAFTYI